MTCRLHGVATLLAFVTVTAACGTGSHGTLNPSVPDLATVSPSGPTPLSLSSDALVHYQASDPWAGQNQNVVVLQNGNTTLQQDQAPRLGTSASSLSGDVA